MKTNSMKLITGIVSIPLEQEVNSPKIPLNRESCETINRKYIYVILFNNTLNFTSRVNTNELTWEASFLLVRIALWQPHLEILLPCSTRNPLQLGYDSIFGQSIPTRSRWLEWHNSLQNKPYLPTWNSSLLSTINMHIILRDIKICILFKLLRINWEFIFNLFYNKTWNFK